MDRLSQQAYNIKSNILFAVVSVLFFLMFAILYAPSFGSSEGTMALWNDHSDLSIPILCAIALVIILLSRLLLIATTRSSPITQFEYLLWQVSELVLISLFSDLFLSILFHKPFFLLLPRILAIVGAIAIYPYTIYWLYIERRQREIQLAEAQTTIANLRQGLEAITPQTINFQDENGIVKLAVTSDRVISIESAGNYVTILYDDDGHLARFPLRNSLKGIEALCQDYDLIRCHRSFFLNIHKVKLLRRDPSGLFAEIDYPGVADIPVSKTYSAEVSHLFSIR